MALNMRTSVECRPDMAADHQISKRRKPHPRNSINFASKPVALPKDKSLSVSALSSGCISILSDRDVESTFSGSFLRLAAISSMASVLVGASSLQAAHAESMATISNFSASDLQAGLKAQIQLDLQSDLELAGSHIRRLDTASSLLEMAEHFEEIDSRLPSDVLSAPLLKDGNSPEIVPTSFAGVSMSGAAAMAAGNLTSAIVKPAASAAAAVVPAAAGLSAKIAAILAESVQHFGGGGLAGAIGATVVYPLDTIKTKMQAQRKEDDSEEELEYKNELDCLIKMVQKDGIGSLYSGIGPQLIGVAPEKAIKLTVNELILQILEVFLPGTRIWMLELIAGGGGGFSQVVFTNPVETIKVRLQTQGQAEDGSAPKTTMEIIKELGFKGLYHGSAATLARDVPGTAVFFACYTVMKQIYPDQYFLDGSLAAIPAAFICTPADVIKTRLTVDPMPGQEPYTDAWDCAKQIVAKEGFGALFKGWGTRVLRISPQFGITLMVYDMFYH